MKELLWPRPGERLLPALSGFLLALSYPPLHLYLPPFMGLIPFAIWICELPEGPEGRRAAVRGSLLFGAIYFGIVFYWILIALVWFTWLAVPAFLATIAILSGLAALVGWGLHRSIHGTKAPIWVALPAVWTAGEWFRGHWPDSLAFPWLGLGSSLTGAPELVGVAEIVGARGVTLWIAAVNALGATMVLALRRGERWLHQVGAALALALLPMAWGVWRADSLATRVAARVAVVQPNIPEHVKLDPEIAVDSTFASLDGLMARLAARNAAHPPLDLIVLPEVVLPGIFPGDSSAENEIERMRRHAESLGAPIVFGGLGHEFEADGGFTLFNSAFLVTPEGLAHYRYDKRHLVPVVERVPFLPANLLGGLDYFGIFGVGRGWPLVEVGDAAFGPLICYESSYPSAARALRLRGADVLLNLTNDAWYGREEFWARTTALWQHPAHMVMRAIETRTGVARAANTGISLFVDPVGRVSEATELFTADVRVHEVETTDELTVYAKYGDLAGGAATAVALLLVASAVASDRRLRRDGVGSPNHAPR